MFKCMKQIANILFAGVLTLGVFTIVLYASCSKKEEDKCTGVACLNGGACAAGICVCPSGYSGPRCEIKDPCMNIVCLNGGTCVNGICNCPSGYEGTNCQTATISKFVGSWTGTDNCGSGTYPVTMSIGQSSTTPVNAVMTNPGGFGGNVVIVGAPTTANTFDFFSQPVGGTLSLSGTITFVSTNSMTFQYTVVAAGGTSDTCTGTYTKQ